MAEIRNVAELLTAAAQQYRDRDAVLAPVALDSDHHVTFQSLTFAQLENLVNAYSRYFVDHGIRPGMKALMMMRPGLEFTAAAFAMFKTGAVPVLIDPGMGRRNFLNCVRNTRPEALVALSAVHWLRYLVPGSFRSVKLAFSGGKLPPPGVFRLEKAATPESIRANAAPVEFAAHRGRLEDPAAILFTTGSTGPAKGVEYTHKTFITQVETIRKVYGTGPHYVDMSAFPLFALFAVVLGMKSVIPQMDFTRPAHADPQTIINIVNSQQVSFSFGSPAFWRTVAGYCVQHHLRLSSLKLVLMAGAPVDAELHRLVKQAIAPDGETRVPYGATEALPISDFNGTEMLAETAAKTARGEGYCVGYPNPGMTIRIIRCRDEVIPRWNPNEMLPPFEKGEIVVRGDVVTAAYHQLPEATAKAKILDYDGGIWHRMGDIGYVDDQGRIWFCGRKNHRVVTPEITCYSVCTEAIFNHHPQVRRTALVGVPDAAGKTVPVLMIQPQLNAMPDSAAEREKFIADLRDLGKDYPFCAAIREFLFLPEFPVDIRHNAKIFREKLAVKAAQMLAHHASRI